MPKRWQESCIGQRTLLLVWIVPGGDECSFSPVFRLNEDIVISPSDIHFGEDWWPFEFVNQVGDKWKQVGIFDSMGVQIPVVLTWSYKSILFWYKKEWQCLWRLGWNNLPRLEMFVNKCSASFFFLGVEWIDFGHFWGEPFIEFNGMVKGSWWGEFINGLLFKNIPKVNIWLGQFSLRHLHLLD